MLKRSRIPLDGIAQDGRWRFLATDFHGLKQLDWSPSGVSLLAGPNGAGKTTTLTVIMFLATAMLRGLPEALRFAGGAPGFRRWDAVGDVTFGLVRNGVAWSMEIPVLPDGFDSAHGERLTLGSRLLLDVPVRSATYTDGAQQMPRQNSPEVRTFAQKNPNAPWLAELSKALSEVEIYAGWTKYELLRPHGEDSRSTVLHYTGRNVFTVLLNWKASPRVHAGKYDWVLAHWKRAFPGQVEDIEAMPDGTPAVYPVGARGAKDTFPVSLLSDGVIVGLAILVAAASAKDGVLMAFDEFETHLHPHAIRSLLASLRERASARNLTILLTSHSPVLMNEFKGHEDHFFVMQAGADGAVPTPLTGIHREDWLAHFALGDLYEREEFGAPPVGAP